MPQVRPEVEPQPARETGPAVPRDQPEDDPYPYGWRFRRVPTADGREELRCIPLTREDLLDPQEGDQVTQNTIHRRLVYLLTGLLERRYHDNESIGVFSDLKVCFKRPGLRGPGPDVFLVRGIRDKERQRGSFQAAEEAGEIEFVAEVVSSDYAEKDYEFNRLVYEKAGVSEYLIVDPVREDRPCRLTGYRLDDSGSYALIAPDAGRLYFATLGLWFAPDPEGGGVSVTDASTGERLRTAQEEADRAEKEARRADHEARRADQQAQRVGQEAQRADQEAAARRTLEDEVARLRQELRRQRSSRE